ncbi:restriction endonuclease subunit S [Desulforegula conservatrix]|uniref:restriction endonuclease subunit S n=1 Tax=Desulforegula conservatrix TaxID=153026 RepID=UPI000425C577|nr:restriction endonuclease subunit S [Desulforegula conservatrix]
MKWQLNSLITVCNIEMGQAPPGKSYNEIGEGVPLIAGAGDFDGNIPNVKKFTTSPSKISTPGDIILGIRASIGEKVWSDRAYCLGRGVVGLRPKSELHPQYLWHWLDSAKHILLSNARGATFLQVNRKDIESLEIPLPPLAEQKRIAEILDAADALRAKRRESLAQLDNLLQSTFLDMFGDPVTNPKGWEVIQFQKIGKSRLGKMLDKGKQKGDCLFPYLANFNVQWFKIELKELRYMDFTEADRKEFELQKGDLLICEGGEVGRAAIWQDEHNSIYFQKALHRVRLYPDFAIPEYVLYYMWFMASNGGFKDFINSATIAHLTGVSLKILPFPCAPISLQRRFASIVESVEKQKEKVGAHLVELDALFASLQSRAFNGEL